MDRFNFDEETQSQQLIAMDRFSVFSNLMVDNHQVMGQVQNLFPAKLPDDCYGILNPFQWMSSVLRSQHSYNLSAVRIHLKKLELFQDSMRNSMICPIFSQVQDTFERRLKIAQVSRIHSLVVVTILNDWPWRGAFIATG